MNENGHTTWKVVGPDFDGIYGGQNGTGGFEAIVPAPELFCPLISDVHGNLLAVYDPHHSGPVWYMSRLTAYGAVPGYRPVPLGQGDQDLGAKYAWRNRAMTSIGYAWLGGNWYNFESGRFLTFDALGHVGNREDGYGLCRISPLVDWDPDGRLASAAGVGLAEGLKDFSVTGFHSANSLTPGGFLSELVWGPLIAKGDARFGEWKDSVVSGFSPWQGNVYAGSGVLGEVLPNFIPVAGAEEAVASVLGRLNGWAARNAPILVRDVGELAASPLRWVEPRLNPANYSFNTGRMFSGVPWPEYQPPVRTWDGQILEAEDLAHLTIRREGVIYQTPDPYVGSTVDLEQRAAWAYDGMNRSEARIVDTFLEGDKLDRFTKERAAIFCCEGLEKEFRDCREKPWRFLTL